MADSTIQILEGLSQFGAFRASPLTAMGALEATASPRAEPAFFDGAPSKSALLAGAVIFFLWWRSRQQAGLGGLGMRVDRVYAKRRHGQRRRFVGYATTMTRAEKKRSQRSERALRACLSHGLTRGTKAFRNCYKQIMRRGKRRAA